MLPKLAVGSIVTLTVRFDSKRSTTTRNGKCIDTFAVSDNTGSIKFSSWERAAGDPIIGKVYELTGVRIKKDDYGSLLIITPQSGFSIKPSKQAIKSAIPEDLSNSDSDPVIKGEVLSVQMISKYLICVECGKKVVDSGGKMLHCMECNNPMKKSLCESGCLIKFKLVVAGDKRKLSLTMFKEELLSILPKADQLDESQLKLELCSLDEIVITKNKKDVVTSIAMATQTS